MRPPKENALRQEGVNNTFTKGTYHINIVTHPFSEVKEKLVLPDLARSILKKAIVSMANVGLITGASAEQLISLLQLRDA